MKISRLFDDIEIKIICLLLAVVMWLYASKGTLRFYETTETTEPGEQARITLRGVPVQLKGLPQGQWKLDHEEITLQVECPTTAEIPIGDLQAIVQLTPGDKEQGWVILTAQNVQLPEGLGFVKVEPDRIRFSQQKPVRPSVDIRAPSVQ